MAKKKYKINWKRFSIFIIVAVLLIALVIFGISKLINSIKNRVPDPAKCRHKFESSVCIKCGYECQHEYKDGVCAICGKTQDPRLLWPNTSTEKSEYPLKSVSGDYLVLVNKQYHMAESYVPQDLIVVDRYVLGVGDPSQYTNCLRKAAADALNKMLDDAEAQGLYIRLRTGYRSYQYQNNLFKSYAANHGEEEANKYSARPGQSEHQTGLACDLGAESQSYELRDDFDKSPEGKWVTENCAKYGFILRYSDGTPETVGAKTGYIKEAWHFRYVGEEAAKIITENGFTLEEYLEEIEKAE